MITALASALTGGALGALVAINRYGLNPRPPAASDQAVTDRQEQP